MIPCSMSRSLRVSPCNSEGLIPVSVIIVNRVLYLRVHDPIILVIWSFVGIIGVLISHLYFGFVHVSPLVLVK